MAEQKDPQNLGLDTGEKGGVIPFPQSGETRDAVSKTLKETKAEGAKTLKDYLDDLRANLDNPKKAEKFNKLKIVLISLGEHVEINPENVLLVPLPEDKVGENQGKLVAVDPVLLKQGDLSILRHTLAHEETHLVEDLDHEGLTELRTMSITGDIALDYQAEVENTLQVVGLLNEDKDKAILRAIELYSNEKYDDLFGEFTKKYTEKYPEKVAQNPDAALNTFQLAFPRLHVSGEGAWEFDETEDEDYAEVA